MGPEQTDIFIMLHPRSEWKTGRDKQALVDAIHEDLSTIPGLRFSFSQPIALRVNELISGVKSDVAVKVFGPDIDVLKDFADRAAAVLQVSDRKVRYYASGAEDIPRVDWLALDALKSTGALVKP